MSNKNSFTFLTLLLLAIFSLACGKFISDKDAKSVQATAKPLIDALERYRVDFGRYPGKLKWLTPKYIPEIPEPNWGVKRWDYFSYPNESKYSLYLKETEDYYAGYHYMSKIKEWGVNN